MKNLVVGAALLALVGSSRLAATQIWAPMWDIRSLPMTWEVKAESSSLVVNSFNADGATFQVWRGGTLLSTVSGYGDVTSGALATTAGEILQVKYTSGFHVRPNWVGAEWARLGIGTQGSGPNGSTGFPSDAELGFDTRWGHLPSQYADTTWSFNVAAGEQLKLSVEHMTGNIYGAKKFEFISPTGVVTVADANGMPGSGGAHFQARGGNLAAAPDPNSVYWDEYSAPVSEAGWWGFKLYAADGEGVPYSWHYVLDRMDAGNDQYIYLRAGSILDPNKPVPDSVPTVMLLVLAIAVGVLSRRKTP